MTSLSVNLNRIALLRNSRNIGIPSVIASARTVLAAGAYGITVHPRPDLRHIRPNDVDDLAQLLTNEFSDAEYNIEGNPFRQKEQYTRVYPSLIYLPSHKCCLILAIALTAYMLFSKPKAAKIYLYAR